MRNLLPVSLSLCKMSPTLTEFLVRTLLTSGKTTRTKPEHVRVDYVKIPGDFIEMHKFVMLVADMLFINGLPFLVTSSRGISLTMIEFLPSRTAKRLELTLEQVIRVYGVAGFIVQVA